MTYCIKTKLYIASLTTILFISTSTPSLAKLPCSAKVRAAQSSISLYRIKPSPNSDTSNKKSTLEFIKNVSPKKNNLIFNHDFIVVYLTKNKFEIVLEAYDNQSQELLGLVREKDIKKVCSSP